MMESSEVVTKSSNEILTELFGAFNAEPPKIKLKRKRQNSCDGNDSKHSKKSRKNKNKKSKKKDKSKVKKSKKKHKSKSRKHKTRSSEEDIDSSSSLTKSKKRKRSKEMKNVKQNSSPNSVSIELPVNKVPMALEIMLDGTVGIKGEDGVITKILDVHESEKSGSEFEPLELETNVNNNVDDSVKEWDSDKKIKPVVKNNKTEGIENMPELKVPEIFESEVSETGEKQKKGKIQIKDLKFSSVFQETIKAVEEKKKKEEEKKANFEEGELSDSTDDDQNSRNEGDKFKSKSNEDYPRHKHKSHHRRSDQEHLSKKRRSSRSRSRSTSHHRSHDRYHSSHMRHRSRSRDDQSFYYSRDSRRHSPSSKRSHLPSRSRESHRSCSRSQRSRSIDRGKSRSNHRSRSKESKHYSRGKSKDRSESIEKIDKEKLLAIARKNALKLIDAGVVPGAEKLTTIKAGGKTVNELTEYCKKLSKKEALGDDVSDIESESSEDEEKLFHHPFQVRDKPSSIIMNIKNSTPLPVKSLQEKAAEQAKQLRLQFPVSSGSSHRRTESEWVPVSPKKEEVNVVKQPVVTPLNTAPSVSYGTMQLPSQPPMPMYLSAVPPPEINLNKPVFPVIQPDPQTPKLDISSIVSKRLEAIRKLQENPNDFQALIQMYSAQREMQYWAESKQETGAFTGSTGVKILSASELSSGAQAWAKRDQLKRATPVRGGMGMALLQKMGWQPGEGLGKNKEGTLEPLRLEVKMDKKGLLAPDETRKGKKNQNIQQGPPLPTVKTLDGKHPVSLLNELCSRRRYGVPQFELCFEGGPDHKKNFLFKVKVNGVEYTPTVASPNKKQAKAEAAAICLRALGIISNNPQN